MFFFSLESNYEYYVQLWNRSDANNDPETLTGEKLCRIPTDFLRTFPSDFIHGGGFKTLNSSGNFRVQLVVTSPFFEQTDVIYQSTLELEYSTVDDSFLNRYKFDVEEKNSFSDQNNNYNDEVNHYSVSRINDKIVQSKSCKSQLYVEIKSTSINPGKDIPSKLLLTNCNRKSSLQSTTFSSPVKTTNHYLAVGSKIDDNVKQWGSSKIRKSEWDHYQPKLNPENLKSVWDHFTSNPSGHGLNNVFFKSSSENQSFWSHLKQKQIGMDLIKCLLTIYQKLLLHLQWIKITLTLALIMVIMDITLRERRVCLKIKFCLLQNQQMQIIRFILVHIPSDR